MKYWKTIKEFIVDEIVYPIRIFFRVQYERSSRSIAFAIFTWDQVDFDSYSMYALVAFKLERTKKCMDEGYGVYPKETMDAMKEAIRICKRLYNEDYDSKYMKIHNKKWGKLNIKKLIGEDRNFNSMFSRKNVKTKADDRKESKESLECMRMGEQDRLNDLDRLNEILKKYQSSWWD